MTWRPRSRRPSRRAGICISSPAPTLRAAPGWAGREGGEGLGGVVARAQRYVEAGADAIFPEALSSAAMFREFAQRLPGVPLLANMTEFGRTPFLTADE